MKKSSLILFVAALFVTAVPAFAATLPYEDTQALPFNTNTTLNLSKFDTSLGTLTGVWVQIELRLNNAKIELDNDDVALNGTAQVINMASSLTSSVTLQKADLDTINTGDLTINAFHVFALDETTGDPVGVFNATLSGDYGIWMPGTLTSGDSGNINSSVWGGYQGTGDFTVTVKSSYFISADFEGGNGYFTGNPPTGELYGKVIYTYEPIPEPATMTILTISALGFLKRKNGK